MKAGDIGVEFVFEIQRKDEIPIPFDEVESFSLYLKYEDSEEINEVIPSVISEESQTVNYYTVDGDLYQEGWLFLEIKITMNTGQIFRTKTVKVKVDDSISYPEII